MVQYSYWAKREVRTYAELYHGAKTLLEAEKELEKGGFYQVMASLILSAFAVEAWLNHLGEKNIEYWQEIDRIPPISKLKIIYQHLKLNYDPSKRPIQTIIGLFYFRNRMAHSRSEILEENGILKTHPDHHIGKIIKTKWEKYCKKENAEIVLNDVKIVIEELAKVVGVEYPIDCLGSEESVTDPAI